MDDLIKRIKAGEQSNGIDMEIEIASFQPDRIYKSVEPNAAGTKLIYTTQDGGRETCWAWDWTLNDQNREIAISALSKAQSSKPLDTER